jgi:NAD binding domain of 6-phosphogluconate dehydrogenase
VIENSVIGFIGPGDLGLPMVQRLVAQGHDVLVWNRTRSKIENVVQLGARAATSPVDLMRRSQLVGLCLASDNAVEEVAFGRRSFPAASLCWRRRSRWQNARVSMLQSCQKPEGGFADSLPFQIFGPRMLRRAAAGVNE